MPASPRQLGIIKETIRDFDPESEIVLFGVADAEGEAGEAFDILLKSAVVSGDDQKIISHKLMTRLGARAVEIVLPTDSNQALVSFAEREGIIL